MSRTSLLRFVAAAVSVLVVGRVSAVVVRMELPDLLTRSDLIVHAVVTATEPRLVSDEHGTRIDTFYTFRVTDVLKGEHPDAWVDLSLPGGTLNGTTYWVSDTPAFVVDEQVVLFLRGDPPALVGAFQGAFRVRGGAVPLAGRRVPAESFFEAVRRAAADKEFDIYSVLVESPPQASGAGAVPANEQRAIDKPATESVAPGEVVARVDPVAQRSTEQRQPRDEEAAHEPGASGPVPPAVVASGQVPDEDVVPHTKAVISAPTPGPWTEPGVTAQGEMPAGEVVGSPKDTPPTAAVATGLPVPLALTARIYNAWWSNAVDEDGDGYVRSARLNWDPDVSGGTGSLSVYEKIYYKVASNSTWVLAYTTSAHTITGVSTSDQRYVTFTGGTHNPWDWRIEVFRSGVSTYDYARDPSNDTDLNDYKMETAAEDTLKATIYNAWWSNLVDEDGDGYVRSARLNWDPDVSGGTGSLSVYEKIYYKVASNSTWVLAYTTSAHTITGVSTSDQRYVTFTGGTHNPWDWRIEVFRSGVSTYDYARDPSNDTDLNDYKMETEAEDTVLRATISNAWWTNRVDEDLDGYARSAVLNWDPNVTGGSGSLTVYEKVYFKVASASTWTLALTTSTHTITGTSASDQQAIAFTGGTHNLWDWKIEVYRSGASPFDYARDPSNDADLDDYRMETSAEDVLTATISNVWWSDAVDEDGDGYVRSARLNWDPDVSGGTGSLSVYEKIYYKVASSSTWTLATTTSAHTISGHVTTDQQYVTYNGGTHNPWDWKIEIYRAGESSFDSARDPSNDGDLDDYRMETIAEDTSIPVITSIVPGEASAGTGTVVTINGLGFDSAQGSGIVEFHFGKDGYPDIQPENISSWSASRIVCEVPAYVLENLAGTASYLASAGSGPVRVTNNAGETSAGYDFDVTFGTDGARWAGTNPEVDLYVDDALPPHWQEAILFAANDWNATAGIQFNYAGTIPDAGQGLNFRNEIGTADLDAGVIAQAGCTVALGLIVDCDVIFNDADFNFSTGLPPTDFDLETITKHELGHWLRLLDLYGAPDAPKVMYGFGAPGQARRRLHADDAAGGRWIYGNSVTQVGITDVALDLDALAPGGMTRITYAVDATAPQAVLLGARARLAGTTSWSIDDAANDRKVNLPGGPSQHTRDFTVPAGTTAGRYDLQVILWRDVDGDQEIGAADQWLTSSLDPDAFSVCTQPPVPILTAPASGSSGVPYVVTWTGSSPDGNYLLQEATDPSFTSATGNSVSGTDWSFTHAVSLSTTYYYRVRALYGCGGATYLSAWSGAGQTTVKPPQHALTVTRGGTGSGTVTSSPAGINCGSTCGANFDYNTAVTLSAAAGTGSTFSGWSGEGCSGTGTCEVTMTQARTVTATFTLNTYVLSVTKAGTGGGTVTSSPAGITCGSSCSASFDYNTLVTLSASAGTGSSFSGWSGACSGTGSCQVTMDGAKGVTATFNLAASNDLTLANQTISSAVVHEVSGSIYAGPALAVVSPARLTLRAGAKVVLRNGVAVGTGARLTVANDPGLAQ
jgi:hypothetical protein